MRFSLIRLGFWFGGKQVHAGKTDAGKVITTFWACLIAAKSFKDVLPMIVILQKGYAAARLMAVVMNQIEQGRKQSRKTDGYSPQFCEGDVEIRNASGLSHL